MRNVGGAVWQLQQLHQRKAHIFYAASSPFKEVKTDGVRTCIMMRYSITLQAANKTICALELLLQISDGVIHGLQIVLALEVGGLIEGEVGG